MEKRLILAIVLSFLVLFGWQALFNKPDKTPPKPEVQTAAVPVQETPGAVPEQQKAAAGEPEQVPPRIEQPRSSDKTAIRADGARTYKVITSLYTAEWSNEGGVLKSWTLSRYKDKLKKDENGEPKPLELVPMDASKIGYPFSVDLDDDKLDKFLNKDAKFAVTAIPDPNTEGDVDLRNVKRGELTFTFYDFYDGAWVKAEKVFRFVDGSYAVETETRVWRNDVPAALSVLWGPGIGNPTEADNKQRRVNRGLSAYSGGDRPAIVRVSEKSVVSKSADYRQLRWAAYEDHYFVALFAFPDQNGRATFRQESGPDGQTSGYVLSVTQPQRAFIGPKESDALKAFGDNAKDVINYGKFIINLKAIAEIMLVAVRYFHTLIPNWGIAIILLTTLIKIIFFPLTYSSTKSMAKMADLQPKVKAIRNKYKKSKTDIDQRRQMNEEMMKLYKEQGVNPAGGCLPMLIQLPVFIGIYQMLLAAIEFRHSPFVFWIRDLSVHDPTFITPVLMGVTQFISQKMTPTSADPSQAKMMLIMPIFMTFIFLYFQSGLVLYWLTSNVLQIGQQAIINRMMHRHAPAKAK